jgi:hypothetical protein
MARPTPPKFFFVMEKSPHRDITEAEWELRPVTNTHANSLFPGYTADMLEAKDVLRLARGFCRQGYVYTARMEYAGFLWKLSEPIQEPGSAAARAQGT